jgi:hypothetical protein
MKYTIISIDDSRQANKDELRLFLLGHEEVHLDFCNGKDPADLRKASEYFNVPTPGPFKAGEFGIFYSVLTCLEYGAANDGIIYFEDDAIPTVEMNDRIENYINALPADWDCFALWSPQNQFGDYTAVIKYDKLGVPVYGGSKKNIFDCGLDEIVRLWQGYGNVAMAFSKQGCNNLLSHIKQEGFYSPIDCLICIAVHREVLNGYALKPHTPKLVDYDWNRPTTIHQSRWGYIEELLEEI